MPSDTNKGTNPQGNITVQFNSKQAPDGVSTYAVFHRYLIKSTSISSLVKLANGVEQFNAKGVVQDLTNRRGHRWWHDGPGHGDRRPIRGRQRLG